ncbi:MAG: hypothetical protein SFU25_06830 [Candidatus Caenarcaniphilales bacterium]|nr:hypothetical protein [Candidatus Caenarcaniphilales bacterium]
MVRIKLERKISKRAKESKHKIEGSRNISQGCFKILLGTLGKML